MKVIGNKWDEVLGEEYAKPYFLETLKRVNKEYEGHKVYPPQSRVFSALKLTDFDDVKVVILGQDPYHGYGQAHGLCFSVLPGVDIPPSLKNIFGEISKDVGGFIPNNGCLIPWAKQGVLLLNTVLTVREGQPQSHKNIGWLTFTDAVIKKLSDEKDGLVFLLWGRNAIDKKVLIDEKKHHILTAPHPSPLSAYNGFFGCKHFSKCNEILKGEGKEAIDWQIPNI
ncbi:MAG: uracil-DNA glycosylase [Clostridia bacterium]|nr:uracil-DNA glycosylase [Clostridia bacterium]